MFISSHLSVSDLIITMSAITRLAVSCTGRQVILRLSQPSVAGVRSLQTSQTSRDIDSGEKIFYWESSLETCFLSRQVHRSRSRHCRSRRVRGWYWISLRVSHHRLRQEPVSQAAALLLRHSGLCPVRGHGTLLFDDGLPPPVRFLKSDNTTNLYWWCSLKYE